MPVDLLLGLQWGDEGKGKIVDVLTADYDIIARFQGGPNAGHTLEFDGIKHVLHTIPSGIFHPKAVNVVGNGVVIDPVIFRGELEKLADFPVDPVKSLLISRKAHLILPTHRLLDAASEAAKGKAKIGSTLKGIGPAYMDKTGRNGLRVGDLELPDWRDKYRALADKHEAMIHFYDVDIQYNLQELEADFLQAVESLRKLTFIDSEEYLFQALDSGKRILAEGAQGSLLDIDFGTYPFVTSSNVIAGQAATGVGIGPGSIDYVLGIVKAYTTRVGEGPFPTELDDADGQRLGERGHEFGTTTGRKRRCGWFDAALVRQTCATSGVTGISLTKLDVLDGFETLKICTGYELDGETLDYLPTAADQQARCTPIYEEMPGWTESTEGARSWAELPANAIKYVRRVEELIQCPVALLSTSPEREDTILVTDPFAD